MQYSYAPRIKEYSLLQNHNIYFKMLPNLIPEFYVYIYITKMHEDKTYPRQCAAERLSRNAQKLAEDGEITVTTLKG